MNKKSKKELYFVVCLGVTQWDDRPDGSDITSDFEIDRFPPFKAILNQYDKGLPDIDLYFANELHAQEWALTGNQSYCFTQEHWEEILKEYPGEWKKIVEKNVSQNYTFWPVGV